MYQRLGNLYKSQRIGAFEFGQEKSTPSRRHWNIAAWLKKHPKLARIFSRGAWAIPDKNKVIIVTPPVAKPTPVPTVSGYGDTSGSSRLLLWLVILALVAGGGYFTYKHYKKTSSPLAARRRRKRK